MKRIAIHLGILCFFVLSFAHTGSAQQVAKVAGKWEATVRMPEGRVTEQWTIQQAGNKITATVKGVSGEQKVTGEVSAVVFRATFKVGNVDHKIMATVDSDVMDGSLMIGMKQYIWQAKRSKS